MTQPNPAALADLIQRLTEATGPDRTLDCAIHAIKLGGELRRVEPPTYEATRYFCNPNPDIDWIGYDLLNVAPAYTASLDSALTLVPEGMGWRAGSRKNDLGEWEHFSRIEEVLQVRPPWNWHHAATPALALCIASLRAREQQP